MRAASFANAQGRFAMRCDYLTGGLEGPGRPLVELPPPPPPFALEPLPPEVPVPEPLPPVLPLPPALLLPPVVDGLVT